MDSDHGTVLINGQQLEALKPLALLSTLALHGLKEGPHGAIEAGPGMDFNQYREYTAGDEIRNLDWKLFARSDRFYIKEFEAERDVELILVIDTSASMAYSENGLSKIRLAKILAACMATIAFQQGDRFGLLVSNEPGYKMFSALPRLFMALENLHVASTLEGFASSIIASARKKMVVLLTDFYQRNNEIDILIERLAANGELLIFHLLGEEELSGMRSPGVLKDLESGKEVYWDRSATVSYQKRVKDWLASCELQAASMGASYEHCLLSENIVPFLSNYLFKRLRFRPRSPGRW